MDDSEKPKKKRRVAAAASPDPPPDLPESFKEWIQRNPVLVIQKRLFSTDVAKQQNRLSIPLSAVRAEFLKDHERQLLDGRLDEEDRHCAELKPTILQGSGVARTISLRKWDMTKQKKKKARSSGDDLVSQKPPMPLDLVSQKPPMPVLHWFIAVLLRVGEELGFAIVKLEEN
uniref:Uncharacterized protein n=1 Tax=Kalanchoe fedtschenkoi TaxID=63787 RepID=A0A7N0TUI8_KALFE